MEIHVSRRARDRYQFDPDKFSSKGSITFQNFYDSRVFAQQINAKHDLVSFPEQALQAASINAAALLNEIFHQVLNQYIQQVNPGFWENALAWLEGQYGPAVVNRAMLTFIDEFPPMAVYLNQQSPEEFLQGSTGERPNRFLLLEDMLLLWLENSNPALNLFSELLDDNRLKKETVYPQLILSLRSFAETQPFFGPDPLNIIEFLRRPLLASPFSLTGQLEFLREKWSFLLGRVLYRILGGLDFIQEEQRVRFPAGPGPAEVPVYAQMEKVEGEVENFSPDREWMPNLILMAKNTYVWLDQLSRQYGRPILHLDEIPDTELELLAQRGFTGLWLIGLWERSQASQRIKQLCGNPDAVASAYSLANYQIAADLGGESAYENLRTRAWQHGIRLASDMVPNHMGIDSNWVYEHPDWFVQLDYSPYPAYTFQGPDLSKNQRYGIFLEDHYYNRTDAAVVFKLTDRWNGKERLIYHGNDGTTMPWNDTAQLNYLNPEVREAVIQTILEVARKFPVIRFDAAMTLAKKHYQRLWYPEPGSGGAIPSRAEHGLTKDQFNTAIPVEFWREVVDRVAQEVPDTLLLAEAFWLMESYFVRTLGMHRVYNSAFMNMLRNEDNANYRLILKNTLEFDPEILKRFVNFMNNPDERTAAEQFGKGDKYFGICILMATLPGLPMFGHGQLEGYTEKYGMEFRRPLWDEKVDENLVKRHEREVFPILHHRYLFADVTLFCMYDFHTPDGSICEDVYAYSNGAGAERAIVIYHNRFASTRGRIRQSAKSLERIGSSDQRRIRELTLFEALGLRDSGPAFVIFREQVSGLEYIYNSQSLAQNGLYVELGAYKTLVLTDMRTVVDDEWHQYAQLTAYLNGRGVPSITEALNELFLGPVQRPFRELANAVNYQRLVAAKEAGPQNPAALAIYTEMQAKYADLLNGVQVMTNHPIPVAALASDFRRQLQDALEIRWMKQQYPLPGSHRYERGLQYLQAGLEENPGSLEILLSWLCVHDLARGNQAAGYEQISRTWIDEWQFGRILVNTYQEFGRPQNQAWESVNLIKLLTTHQNWFDQLGDQPAASILETWLKDVDIQHFLGVNRHKGVLWFHQEAFGRFLWWMMFLAVIQISANPRKTAVDLVEKVVSCFDIIEKLQAAEEQSDYQIDKLLAALK